MKSIPAASLLLVLLCGVAVVPVTAQESDTIEDSKPENQPERSSIPLDEIRTFAEVFTKVKRDYVEELDDVQLLENAIKGLLEGLDPHSTYLDQDAYLDLQEGTSGEFGGLGIEVGMEDGFIKVISPIDDTPAEKAGIKTGDLIIRLDDSPIKGLSLNEAVNRMRGDPGTEVTLMILREGEEKPLKITLVRDVIKVKSVRYQTLEPGMGYLRISNFQTHTAEDARTSLAKLIAENNDRLDGLVVDLRNNPGGILSAAVAVSDLFLDRGLIVYTEGRVKDSTLKFSAKPSDMIDAAPIVVLVNAGSASAAEIVAGALQDHKRGIIMGQKTFGKGSVQTILPISNDSALKLTTARYYTPNGRSIQAAGIEPDIIIDRVKIEAIEDEGDLIQEADLNRHLENNDSDNPDSSTEPVADAAVEQPLSTRDYALYEALNVLKGLKLLSRAN